MIIEFKENVRTLRGAGSSKKYRYTRRVVLQCEECEKIREVNCNQKIRQSDTHVCKSCKVRELGKLNKGKSAWNKISSDIKVGNLYLNSSGYYEVYVGSAFVKAKRKDKYRLLHRLVAEAKQGFPLDAHQLVHHIDGNKKNNHPDNLYISNSRAQHQDIHTQLEEISMKLVQAGIIQFDHKIGQYIMPQLEVILAAYSVNSGEPYVLEIDSLGNMAILSQAENYSEGATTIPLGSRC